MDSLVLLVIWIGVTLSTPYLLLAHFQSTLTIHILHFLHRLGMDKADDRKGVWAQFPEFEPITLTTADGQEHILEWQDWFILAYNGTWFQRMLADLITCPICMTFHLLFWQSLAAIGAVCIFLHVSPWALLLAPVYAITAAIPSLTIYNYVRQHL